MVSFTWAADTDFFRLVTNETVCALAPVRKAGLIRQVEQLRQELRHEDTEDQLLACALLHTLLLTMRREASDMPARRNPIVIPAANAGID